MNILDHEEVLDHQIKLLDYPGQNLSNFHLYSPEQSMFVQPSAILKAHLQKQYRIDPSQLKTCLNHTNTSLQIFTSLLMKIFYQNSQRQDLLQILKCTLYSSDAKIDEIKNMPKRNLSSNVMKKILVQFFQVMQYHYGKAQIMLDKYPIVIQIFILFFRTILKSLNIPGTQDFRSSFETNKAILKLFEYFDFPYQIRRGLYFLNQGQLILYINEEQNHIVYGQYLQKKIFQQQPDPQKDQFIFEMKFQNQFNFNSIGQSPFENSLEINPKDMSTPTPHFSQIQEDIGFQKKKQIKLSSRRNYSRDFHKQNVQIMQTTQLQQIQDDKNQKNSIQQNNIRDNSLTSSLKSNRQNQKIYFQKDHENRYLNSIQSLNSSTPSTDVIEFKDMEKLKANKTEKNRRQSFNISQSVISANDNKSDIFPLDKKDSPDRYKKKDDQLSAYSCSCSQTRLKKNSLHSNVFDINFKKDFTKKNMYTPQTKPAVFQSYSRISQKVKYQHKKIPEFLSKKFRAQDHPSQIQKIGTMFHDNSLAFSRKSDTKPKIYFTYQQAEKDLNQNYSMKSHHVYTQPANLRSKYTKSYQKESNRACLVSPTLGHQGDQIKKPESYQMLRNPRFYRNYEQQKIRFI